MKVKDFRKKNNQELHDELLSLFREAFNLRMQKINHKIKHTHFLKNVRRDIARIKTLLTEKMDKGYSNNENDEEEESKSNSTRSCD